jgi:hypothetical protein
MPVCLVEDSWSLDPRHSRSCTCCSQRDSLTRNKKNALAKPASKRLETVTKF